jgi:hypothetical protein
MDVIIPTRTEVNRCKQSGQNHKRAGVQQKRADLEMIFGQTTRIARYFRSFIASRLPETPRLPHAETVKHRSFKALLSCNRKPLRIR